MTNKKKFYLKLIAEIIPPFLFRSLKSLKIFLYRNSQKISMSSENTHQDINVYWDNEMATLLETWGANSVWKEISLLTFSCTGRILDIACGTGKAMEIIGNHSNEIYGCDISDLLISKAIQRGIKPDNLTLCDATKMPFPNDYFDYAYSIGSLEHFTEEGISQVIAGCYRTVLKVSFHMVPVARSKINEGWLKHNQSFHNNTVAWWLEKFQSVYKTVYVLDSTWEDSISEGKWFVCVKS